MFFITRKNLTILEIGPTDFTIEIKNSLPLYLDTAYKNKKVYIEDIKRLTSIHYPRAV